ncbi:GAF domain-containing protein [Roseateles sp.]|uniref:GAF domain-containing protein n=1 Tax=Roseateles sp. TaxID=1971397 RepID=UPI0039E9F896
MNAPLLLPAPMQGVDADVEAMRLLASLLAYGLLRSPGFRAGVTELMQQRFGCDQIVVWRVGLGAARHELHCLVERFGAHVAIDPGNVVQVHDMAAYFARLRAGAFYADDGFAPRPAAADAQARLLHPTPVASVLHAAAYCNGHLFGIVCCGRISADRSWDTADRIALKRLANRLTLYAAPRHQLDDPHACTS